MYRRHLGYVLVENDSVFSVCWFISCFTLATNTQPSPYGAYQSQANRWPYNYNYKNYKYRNYNFQNSAAKRPYRGKRRKVTYSKEISENLIPLQGS